MKAPGTATTPGFAWPWPVLIVWPWSVLMVGICLVHTSPSAENCEHIVGQILPAARFTMRNFMPGGQIVPLEHIVQSISPGDTE
jgi:hypothetical protein